MKRIMAVLLTLVLTLSLAACGSSGNASTSDTSAQKTEEPAAPEKEIDAAYTVEYEGYELAAASLESFWRVGEEDVSYSQSEYSVHALFFGSSTLLKDDGLGVTITIYAEPLTQEWLDRWNTNNPDQLFEPAEFAGMTGYKRPSSYDDCTGYVVNYEGVDDAFLEIVVSRGAEADESQAEEFVKAIFENLIFRAK